MKKVALSGKEKSAKNILQDHSHIIKKFAFIVNVSIFSIYIIFDVK